MDYEFIKEVKRIAVIAIASKDELMDKLVLKGGSAIEMIYKVNNRASLDIDFSMEDGLSEEEMNALGTDLISTFEETFDEYGYEVIDAKFYKKPKQELDEERSKFWGGYKFEFKLANKEKYKNEKASTEKEQKKLSEKKRKEAYVLGKRNSTKFIIEISPFEYCTPKAKIEFEDLTLYVYSPVMIVLEKVRAICQQIEDYKEVVGTSYRKPRGRDFFDIYHLINDFGLDLSTDENKECLIGMFDAKRVPIDYISRIEEDGEFHKENFETSLKDTLNDDVGLEKFEFYLKFLLDELSKIKF